MVIYPAIDIKDGKCVRLVQGRFDNATVYSEDPVETALKWERAGACFLHLVDLDGARTGKPQNIDIIGRIAVSLGILVQAGGGIRSMEDIEAVLGKRIRRVILGTSAVQNPGFIKEALKAYGSSIAAAIDARDGKVAVEGWFKTSGLSAVDFAREMEDLGVKTVIYTDISRDGTLSGPNFKAVEELKKAVGIEVIASGGISSLDDLKRLKETGVSGVIIGKALYTGDIDLREALELVKQG